MPRELTEFVHGVSPAFLEVGDTKAAAVRTKQQQNNNNNNNNMFASTTLGGSGSGSGSGSGPKSLPPPSSSSSSSSSGVGGDGSGVFSKGAYFIGKAIWAKGYTELLDQLKGHADRTGGQHVPMDVYGGGDDLEDIQNAAQNFHLAVDFKGPRDHLHESIHEYKVGMGGLGLGLGLGG